MGGKYWLFQCDCGKETVKSRRSVTLGYVKSCGCMWNIRPARIDIQGKRFGRLVAIGYIHGSGKWRCVCDCGKEVLRTHTKLINAEVPSCGCYLKEGIRRTHGGYTTPMYGIWSKIKGRCTNPKNCAYERYGGRGIKICDRWLGKRGFENFLADMGERPSPKHSVDRINNDGDYCPENCRWATFKEQANNKGNNRVITHNGISHTLSEWCEIYHANYKRAATRVRSGYSFDDIFTKECLVTRRRKFTDDEVRFIRNFGGNYSDIKSHFEGRLSCACYHQIIKKQTYKDVI